MLPQLRTLAPALLLLVAAAQASAADHRVTVGGTDGGYYGGSSAILAFTPPTVTVAPGDTVTFFNAGGAQHNVHADDDSFRCAAGCDGVAGGDGTPSASGWTSTITITQPGGTEIPFHCDVHQSMGMVGLIKVVAPAGATNVPITSGFSGAWYDPDQSGHGILVEVLPNNQFLAFWFTFNPDGTQQAWFGNVGAIDPATNTASVAALQTEGGQWIPNFDPDNVTQPPWGTLTFAFTDCNHGRVDFTSVMPGFGNGHMDLSRLTQPAGLSCP